MSPLPPFPLSLHSSSDESAEVEADEMLTINAQNLMKSVRDTVRASESCSVKIMSQAGNLQFKRKK